MICGSATAKWQLISKPLNEICGSGAGLKGSQATILTTA